MRKKGKIVVSGFALDYEIKIYEEPSEYGIDGGKVSKFYISYLGVDICSYDRGWVLMPRDPISLEAMDRLLKVYN